MSKYLTTDEWEAIIGEQIRKLRLARNIDRQLLGERAGVSANAIKNLEHGRGSSLKTLVKVLAALDNTGWFENIYRESTVDPLQILKMNHERQRASRKKK